MHPGMQMHPEYYGHGMDPGPMQVRGFAQSRFFFVAIAVNPAKHHNM